MLTRIPGWSSLAALALAGAASGQAPILPPNGSKAALYGYQVQHVYPHDPTAFTQGLQYLDGFLYEGTGLNGRSSIRKVKLETGEVVHRRSFWTGDEQNDWDPSGKAPLSQALEYTSPKPPISNSTGSRIQGGSSRCCSAAERICGPMSTSLARSERVCLGRLSFRMLRDWMPSCSSRPKSARKASIIRLPFTTDCAT